MVWEAACEILWVWLPAFAAVYSLGLLTSWHFKEPPPRIPTPKEDQRATVYDVQKFQDCQRIHPRKDACYVNPAPNATVFPNYQSDFMHIYKHFEEQCKKSGSASPKKNIYFYDGDIRSGKTIAALFFLQNVLRYVPHSYCFYMKSAWTFDDLASVARPQHLCCVVIDHVEELYECDNAIADMIRMVPAKDVFVLCISNVRIDLEKHPSAWDANTIDVE